MDGIQKKAEWVPCNWNIYSHSIYARKTKIRNKYEMKIFFEYLWTFNVGERNIRIYGMKLCVPWHYEYKSKPINGKRSFHRDEKKNWNIWFMMWQDAISRHWCTYRNEEEGKFSGKSLQFLFPPSHICKDFFFQ